MKTLAPIALFLSPVLLGACGTTSPNGSTGPTEPVVPLDRVESVQTADSAEMAVQNLPEVRYYVIADT